MRVEIDETGLMTIRPESPLEAYALRQWMDRQCIEAREGPVSIRSLDTSMLLINASWPQEQAR